MARGTGSYSTGVFGGLRALLAAAIVAAGVVMAPTAALACNGGGPSAVNVYTECVATGSGNKPTGAHSSGQGSGSTQARPVSKQTAKALKHAKNRRLLSTLLRGYGTSHLSSPQSSGADAATAPSAVGAAFDLGSGPTALLLVLAGTAVLLLGGSGLRVWRHRHRA